MFTRVKGRNIYYLREGKGEKFLLVHGWGGTVCSLQGLFEKISQNYDVIALDLPGFGQSDQPGADWGIGAYAEFLLEFLSQLGVKKTAYFGHSFGGSLGIYLSAKYPKRISRLILCGASFKREKKKSRMTDFLKQVILNESLYRIVTKPFRKIFYRIFYPHSDLIKYPHLESNFRKIVDEDLTPLLDKINVDTLIIWGGSDRQTPVELAYLLHKKIKSSKLKIMAKSGHNLPLVNPELVYREIEKLRV